ncbi:hypothetical protein BZL30_4627 [Mycobacterium kansasii]|uniref:Uncharacterized protein n=1 Tax=Mycobacterium kansasii TaxID=1768 RepID=A0A1V3X4V7_MYCKA|nr:hypothetical protein BZL30_4627 [Mycobacterium kansasii]
MGSAETDGGPRRAPDRLLVDYPRGLYRNMTPGACDPQRRPGFAGTPAVDGPISARWAGPCRPGHS